MVETPKRVVATAIVITTTMFVAIVCWLHAVRPDLDPMRSGVSRYAVGDHGYAITAGFAVLSLAALIAASEVRGQFGTALRIASAGLLLVVFFPLRASLPGRVEYSLHQVGGAVFFGAATVGIQGISSRLRAASAPALLQATARVSAALAALALVPFFVSVAARGWSPNVTIGAFQRLCFFAICTALLTLGFGLLCERRQTCDERQNRP